MKTRLFQIEIENYGLNGDLKEPEYDSWFVVAKTPETAIQKLRAAQPKSLKYNVFSLMAMEGEVLG